MKFSTVSVNKAKGAILAHSTRLPGRILKKGHLLTKDDITFFTEEGMKQITVARLGSNDIPENEAATLITRVLAGKNVTATNAFTGRCNLISKNNGLLLFDTEKLNTINLIDESVTVATSEKYGLTAAGQLVATIKIIPFAITKSVLDLVTKAIAEEPLISIAPFEDKKLGLIMTRLPGMKETILDKTLEITKSRIDEFNSKITKEIRCPHTEPEVISAIKNMQKNNCDIILIFGASAVVDRADVLPAAVIKAGGQVKHFGMPVDPGNLLFIGSIGEIPIVGMPGCARSSKLNGFDWVLWRLLANISVTARDIMLMGSGGLLKEISERGQLRQLGNPEISVAREPKIVGLLLAAGSSKRMGKKNKLLAEISGTKMIVHVAEQINKSRVGKITVVTGYEGDQVKSALKHLVTNFVHNPNHTEGLSTSVKLGLNALPDEIDGVIIFLGDMPLIKSHHINRIIEAFDPTEGRSICVPVHGRKRGNPVLWGKQYLGEILSITGDVGARHLLEEYSDQISEVTIDNDAILFDVDTPERLSELESRSKS
jgi:molybdenum cofactor cytidylyltransferase